MFKLLLVCVALSSTQCGAFFTVFGSDWLRDLDASIDKMTSDIDKTMKRIDDQMRDINEKSEEIRKSTAAKVAKISVDDPNTIVSSHEFKFGPNVQTSGHFYSSKSKAGSSKSTTTGVLANGQAYRQETEQTITGNILHGSKKIINLVTGNVTETKWTQDLSDPNAKPVFQETDSSG